MNVGDKIKIIQLNGEGDSYNGNIGIVTFIDALGQLHGTWGDLAIIPEVDSFVCIQNTIDNK